MRKYVIIDTIILLASATVITIQSTFEESLPFVIVFLTSGFLLVYMSYKNALLKQKED